MLRPQLRMARVGTKPVLGIYAVDCLLGVIETETLRLVFLDFFKLIDQAQGYLVCLQFVVI